MFRKTLAVNLVLLLALLLAACAPVGAPTTGDAAGADTTVESQAAALASTEELPVPRAETIVIEDTATPFDTFDSFNLRICRRSRNAG